MTSITDARAMFSGRPTVVLSLLLSLLIGFTGMLGSSMESSPRSLDRAISSAAEQTPAGGSLTSYGWAFFGAVGASPIPPATYAVTFVEVGLSPGMTWSVTLNGSEIGSATSSIGFEEANGSYPYTISGSGGYSANTTSGRIYVTGSSLDIPIDFAERISFATGFHWNSSWSASFYIGTPVVAGAAILLTVIRRFWRGRRGQNDPPEYDPISDSSPSGPPRSGS